MLSSLAVLLRVREEGRELVEGLLRCQGCERVYPVIDGIPVLLRDLAQADSFGLLASPVAPEVAAALAAHGPDGAALPHGLEQQSSYLDGSFGGLADPPVADGEPGFRELASRLRGRSPVALALELGCGVGRGLLELAGSSEMVIGLDRSGASLRAARTLLRGEELRYARRVSGRSYTVARLRVPAADNVQLVCADALDPPFAPGIFGRVVALNLLDNVGSPRALLHHLHQLAESGGEILLSTPYAWRDGIVEAPERLAGAAGLREDVRKLGWMIEEDEEGIPWTLPREAGSVARYQVHWLRARTP